MTEPLFCRHCGKEMQADAQFCPACGKPVAETPVTPVSVNPVKPPVSSSTVRPKSKRGVTVLVILGGLAIICCLGIILISQVIMPLTVQKTFPEVIQTAIVEQTALVENATTIAEVKMEWDITATAAVLRKTEAVKQGNIAKEWGLPILTLITAEKHADEFIRQLTMVKDGLFTKEEIINQMAIPDSFDLVGMFYVETDIMEAKLNDMGMPMSDATRPFFFGLKDDYDSLTYAELYWFAGEKDLSSTLEEINREKEALITEREKIHQAMLMSGMTDEVYGVTIAYYEKEWPGFKMKMDELGIKLLTPEP